MQCASSFSGIYDCRDCARKRMGSGSLQHSARWGFRTSATEVGGNSAPPFTVYSDASAISARTFSYGLYQAISPWLWPTFGMVPIDTDGNYGSYGAADFSPIVVERDAITRNILGLKNILATVVSPVRVRFSRWVKNELIGIRIEAIVFYVVPAIGQQNIGYIVGMNRQTH